VHVYKTQRYDFNPEKYEQTLIEVLKDIEKGKNWDKNSLRQVQAKYPKDKKFMFSKNDLLRGYNYLIQKGAIKRNNETIQRIRMKPIRTQSGVAPVTVLTKPWECPGNCIYCPNELNMPKSYIESEPGAQRAAALNFDPYLQVQRRIRALENIGHNTEKIELIVLGGTWSHYTENYQRWFIKRCFEAMNDPAQTEIQEEKEATWEKLEGQQKINETAKSRCVGLSLETRPELITKEEVVRMRKLGCTKVQIGVQTLDGKLLKLNKRGHSVKQTKEAFKLLRLAGFKIQAHWMVNLYGATSKKDRKDFKKLWGKDFQPDELKIYPTAIIENTKLCELYRDGKYQPYMEEELIELVADLKLQVPEFCRITRIIRDIPAQNIVAGNKKSNLRQIIQEYLEKEGKACECIRCREIRKQKVSEKDLKLDVTEYETGVSKEYFLSFVTGENKIAGFLRLSIPREKYRKKHFVEELKNSAIIREIHIYGQVVALGREAEGKAQHLGLGKRLIEKAEEITIKNKLHKISVISAIGTGEYYRKRGFEKGNLYMGKYLGE